MENSSFQMIDGKVIIRIKDRLCDNADELLSSELFLRVFNRCISDLERRNSRLLGIFENKNITERDIQLLLEALHFLTRLPGELVPKVVDGSAQFFRDPVLFNDFIEYVYNYWRNLQRLIVCDSVGDHFDKRPYHTFNQTVEHLTHLVRSTYRDVQENITGNHPRIYRQVRAGAEVATIALARDILYPADYARKLAHISIIRQILIYPPLIYNSGTNVRTGMFERVDRNPMVNLTFNDHDWLCYPAKVGPLVVMIYFHVQYFELNFSMCNLFELADDEDLRRKPDAVLIFGAPRDNLPVAGNTRTVFYDDPVNDLLVGVIPDGKEFNYFGYLKKMTLTLHNIKMMKIGRMPYHGAMFQLVIRGKGAYTFLVMGDTGAGKSETLEAMRTIGAEEVEDLIIIADDMGSLQVDGNGNVIGYGTETGAFVRLDDLQPGYAFGQIDRTIIMNPNQTNARVVIPVTTFDNVSKGFKVDFVLYANNYEKVDDEHPVLQRFETPEEALAVFREGAVMSKGTTSTTGLVRTYFANIFGPTQYQQMHDELADKYFKAFFTEGAFVGQMRTQLGVPGKEHTGPEQAARFLLEFLKHREPKPEPQ
jgi:hypothetical protein